MLHQKLAKLIEEAAHAQATRAHTPVGMQEPTLYIAVPPVRSTIACLKTDDLPSLFDKSGNLIRAPNAAPAGVSLKLEAAVAAASLVSNSGAHVLIYPEAAVPRSGPNGAIALESVPGSLRNTEAALFSTVDVDSEEDAPVSTLPVFTATIDWSQSIAKGVRIEIPRTARRRIDPEQLSAEIVIALTLGLARAADQVLLSALAAETLDNFTLGAAADQGLLFSELRALVGTSGAGAAVGLDGVLRASGVGAELTGDMSGTIVGAWNRAAIAIKDDVPVHFERLDAAGSLAVTAWASLLPLVPDANKFWTVA